MFCSNAKIEYYGNGSQTDFTFPYEYFSPDEIRVLIWNNRTFKYDSKYYDIDFSLVNASTVRMAEAPPSPAPVLEGEGVIHNVVIIRLTDLEDPIAVFSPGAIRAKDLNDNFDQLRFSIQELLCISDLNTEVNDLSWRKSSFDTLTSTESWFSKEDDGHIATVNAISDFVEQSFNDYDNELFSNAVIRQQQKNGQWISDDTRFATTGAIAERHDTSLGDVGPVPGTFIQPGKFWINTANQRLSYWSQQGFWINVASPLDTSRFIEDAPLDGQSYVRKNGEWEVAPSGGGTTVNTEFAFHNQNTLERGSGNDVSIQGIFLGEQPASVAYSWEGYDSFTQTPADVTPISFQFFPYINEVNVPTSMDNIHGVITATYSNGSKKVVKSNSFCEVFTPFNP